jgi:hypothetical protein
MLQRAAGAERGTAIYGDLVELAATRGRTWFWMAYLRTLLAFTWRTAAGALAGLAFFPLLDKLTGNGAGFTLWVAYMVSPTLANIGIALLVVVPYVTVRYGLRDRVVWLGWMALVLSAASGFYLSRAGVFAVLGAILIGALSARAWRRPAVTLIGTVAIFAATAACLPVNASGTVVEIVALPIAIICCSLLRRWQLAPETLAGGTYA